MVKYFFILMLAVCSFVNAQPENFIHGVDVSFIPQIEDLGGKYYLGGEQMDPLDIFSQNGVDYIRLRIWHTPSDKYCGLQETLDFAKRIKSNGLKFLLDFHYSDWWADPGKQIKPAAWEDLDFQTLADSIEEYTFDVIDALNNVNALPDMVQIGNEITPGFLWPDGRVGGSYDTPQQWENFATLLNRAKDGLYRADPDSTIKIMIHSDRGGDNSGAVWFFNNLERYNVDFDVIGLSFYPWWHGTLNNLKNNLNDLAQRYKKEIVVVEIAYPWTLDWYDNVDNIFSSPNDLHSGYPATKAGQFSFLYDLIQVVKETRDNKGIGVFYWAPEYISVSGLGSPWENLTLFDFEGNALPSIKVFNDEDSSSTVKVTFRLNTATLWDTLSTNGLIQLRGEIVGGSGILPSGKKITWDKNSEIILENICGDYWETTVELVPGTEINYKYWAGFNINNPTFTRLGNESGIMAYDSSIAFRKFITPTADTTLQIEYFNSSSVTKDQYWRSFEEKVDSIAVYFRVNMSKATASGRFNPNVNGPVGIRGDGSTSENILSWDETNIILAREEFSVNDGSFWSGVVYFPVGLIGSEQNYKFYIENDSDNGWENSIQNRTFVVPKIDSTIHWEYFDHNNVTEVEENTTLQYNFKLHQNYPNPFNPSTTITYELNSAQYISIDVYNSIGQKVTTLFKGIKSEGIHKLIWNGNQLSSGIYFAQLKAGKQRQTIKLLLLR